MRLVSPMRVGFGVGLTLATAVLLSSSRVSGDADRPCPVLPLPVPLPDLAQQLASTIQEFDQFLARNVADNGITGFISILVYDQQVLWSNGYGRQNFTDENSPPPTKDSIVRIASLTKLMTGHLYQKLAAAGVVHRDDPIEQFMPTFGMKTWANEVPEPLTLQSLATHASGMIRENPFTWGTRNESEVLTALQSMYRLWQPYTIPHYSNLGFSLLGRCLGHAAGAEYEDLVQQMVFDELGMTSSSFALNATTLARLAVGLDDDGEFAAPIADLAWDNPCGGAFSTAADLATWMSSLFRTTTLPSGSPDASGASTDASMNPFFQVSSLLQDGISGFGVPWELNYSTPASAWVITKAGQIQGYESQIAMIPSLKLGIFNLALQSNTPDPTVWAMHGMEAFAPPLIEILKNNQPPPFPLPTDVERFLGQFQGGVEVYVEAGTKRLMIGPTTAAASNGQTAATADLPRRMQAPSSRRRSRVGSSPAPPSWSGDLLVVTDFMDDPAFPAFRVALNSTDQPCRWLDDGSEGEILYLRLASPDGPPTQLVFMGDTFDAITANRKPTDIRLETPTMDSRVSAN